LAEGPAGSPEYRQAWGVGQNNLALVLDRRQNPVEAERAYLRGVEILEKLVADYDAVADYRRELARTCTNLGNHLRDQGRYDEAEPVYRRAVGEYETLVQRFGAMPACRLELASSKVQLGHFLRLRYGPGEALRLYDGALSVAWPLRRQEPRDMTARWTVWRAHWRRAEALGDLGRHAEALADWEQVLALSPMAERPEVRLERARSLARAGYATEAVAEAEALTKSPGTAGPVLCGAAGVYSLATAGQDEEVAERYARRALALLRRARAAGYFNDRRRAEELKRDANLAWMWAREAFRSLVAALDAAGQP
jgi:tetratricopeptide (TPR) repeat protein